MTTTFRMGIQGGPLRRILLRVLDAMDGPAAGAKVELMVNRREIGWFTTDHAHAEGTLEVDRSAEVAAVAHWEGHAIHKELHHDEDKVEFRFPGVATPGAYVGAAEARCLDGTTGRPCVVCKASTGAVRICV